MLEPFVKALLSMLAIIWIASCAHTPEPEPEPVDDKPCYRTHTRCVATGPRSLKCESIQMECDDPAWKALE